MSRIRPTFFPHTTRRRSRSLFAVLAAGILWFSGGCDGQLVTEYGHSGGVLGSQSVNGLSVLASMFESAGHRVTDSSWLSPNVGERADVIVWAPNRFGPPSFVERAWFENWLHDGEDRVLVYIGRDYDAAPEYWRTVMGEVPADERSRAEAERSAEEGAFAMARQSIPEEEDAGWFVMRRRADRQHLQTADAGADDWLADLESGHLDIDVGAALDPAPDAEVLLSAKDEPLVSWLPLGWGRIIVVNNGSFLLNLPLVNHEHRKLAGKLINEVSPDGATRRVVFLNSGPGDVPIHDQDPVVEPRSLLDVFPLDWIILQLVVVGALVCMARWPVFGRPRQYEAESRLEFGRHVEALGELLEKTGDAAFARQSLLNYGLATGKVAATAEPRSEAGAAPLEQKPAEGT